MDIDKENKPEDAGNDDLEIPAWHKQILDERLARFYAGEEKLISMEELIEKWRAEGKIKS